MLFHVKHYSTFCDIVRAVQHLSKSMINKEEFYKYYNEIFTSNGLQEFCTPEIIEKMFAMSEYMLEVNSNMNLTAITETPDIIAKHLADSVIASRFIPQSATVCDIGCGGGFPSLPLAIARPDITILGVDSTEKRINYVNASAKRLDLSNLSAIPGRAEDLATNQSLREHFDVCIARAVASLPILSELCIPFVKQDGLFVAMKGRLSQDEVTQAPQKLGAEPIAEANIHRYFLKTANTDEERCIVCLRKCGKTDGKYPRNYSQIKKKPL